MDKLFELITMICGGNLIPRPKGVFIPMVSVNAELLSTHRDEINQLCVESNLRLGEIPPEMMEVPEMDGKNFLGMKEVVIKGREGGLWLAKSNVDIDAFSASLS